MNSASVHAAVLAHGDVIVARSTGSKKALADFAECAKLIAPIPRPSQRSKSMGTRHLLTENAVEPFGIDWPVPVSLFQRVALEAPRIHLRIMATR